MLSYFKIRNFKSILDVTVDFSYAEGKAPNNYEQLNTIPFLEVDKKNRFVPCMAFYGANASGKSNIIEALYVLKLIIKKGINRKYRPNKLNNKYNCSLFEIEFFKDKTKYLYSIEYNKETILKEFLFKNNKTLYSIDKNSKNDFTNIQTEIFNEKYLNNFIDVKCSEFNKEEKRMQTKTFLSATKAELSGLTIEINNVFEYISSLIKVNLKNDLPYQIAIDDLSDGNDNDALQISFDKISKILTKFDIDIERMSINRETCQSNELKNVVQKNMGIPVGIREDKEKKILEIDFINSYHKDINNKEVMFNFREESNGTQILLSLIGFVLHALEKGSVLVIDEIDRAIHPMILIQIIKMFKDKDNNKKNAQLIFTCHATDILSEEVFRISEVSFISKNLKDGSTTKRISDFKDKDIRNVTDFRKLYWNGVFGGIPYPYI